MRHNKTKQMLSYWMELFLEAGNVPGESQTIVWPERSEVHPARCRALLSDMFILENTGGDHIYRLAGTQLCATFGRELKRESFASSFHGADKRSIEGWLSRLGLDEYVVLISANGETEWGDVVGLETLLLPLSHSGVRGARVLGITSVHKAPHWVGSEPLVEQSVKSIRVIRPWEGDRYLGNWPFHAPAGKAGAAVERLNVTPPPMDHTVQYPRPTALLNTHENEHRVRRVAHLTVFSGGLDGTSK